MAVSRLTKAFLAKLTPEQLVVLREFELGMKEHLHYRDEGLEYPERMKILAKELYPIFSKISGEVLEKLPRFNGIMWTIEELLGIVV